MDCRHGEHHWQTICEIVSCLLRLGMAVGCFQRLLQELRTTQPRQTSLLNDSLIKYYLMAAANAADPKTERNRLGGSGRVGPSRAE